MGVVSVLGVHLPYMSCGVLFDFLTFWFVLSLLDSYNTPSTLPAGSWFPGCVTTVYPLLFVVLLYVSVVG